MLVCLLYFFVPSIFSLRIADPLEAVVYLDRVSARRGDRSRIDAVWRGRESGLRTGRYFRPGWRDVAVTEGVDVEAHDLET